MKDPNHIIGEKSFDHPPEESGLILRIAEIREQLARKTILELKIEDGSMLRIQANRRGFYFVVIERDGKSATSLIDEDQLDVVTLIEKRLLSEKLRGMVLCREVKGGFVKIIFHPTQGPILKGIVAQGDDELSFGKREVTEQDFADVLSSGYRLNEFMSGARREDFDFLLKSITDVLEIPSLIRKLKGERWADDRLPTVIHENERWFSLSNETTSRNNRYIISGETNGGFECDEEDGKTAIVLDSREQINGGQLGQVDQKATCVTKEHSWSWRRSLEMVMTQTDRRVAEAAMNSRSFDDQREIHSPISRALEDGHWMRVYKNGPEFYLIISRGSFNGERIIDLNLHERFGEGVLRTMGEPAFQEITEKIHQMVHRFEDIEPCLEEIESSLS